MILNPNVADGILTHQETRPVLPRRERPLAERRPAGPGSTKLNLRAVFVLAAWFLLSNVFATPANKASLDQHFDRFLPKNLNQCSTCHLPSPLKDPQSLAEFPHNPFGDRLKLVAKELGAAGKKKDMPSRFSFIASEDSDGDGVNNETEILLGHSPGDASSKPSAAELAIAPARRNEFSTFLSSYRWRPFESVVRPALPESKANPVDAFLARSRNARGIAVQASARKEFLLRRVYQDLIGLNPTPEEQKSFLNDPSPVAYEKVVDRLLADPRHGERWGRHWMDVWRYSDWAGWADGNQVRDSKPHIWRWRDWIIESINRDQGYDRMLVQMLAADELAPLDPDALRATGFLVRNFKMLSREQWMEDTVKHTFQAFLGVTVGCAKCHDHMTDPISQLDYYRVRSIFDPHHVRTDPIPGQPDTAKDGLVRAYDQSTNRLTYLLKRGDERHPETNRVVEPGVPASLTGATHLAALEGRIDTEELPLPVEASKPHQREFVRRDLLSAAEESVRQKLKARDTAGVGTPIDNLQALDLELNLEQCRLDAQSKLLEIERIEERGKSGTEEWKSLARQILIAQRELAVAEARLDQHRKRQAVSDAKSKIDGLAAPDEKASKAVATSLKALADSETKLLSAIRETGKEPTTEFKPRTAEQFPRSTSGRRLRFARWIADPQNPLTARVAVNHIWLRHFGRGLAVNAANFGRLGGVPDHPELLDWLASEFMARGWSMKWLHRLLVTSDAYRLESTPLESSVATDPDNRFYWRMNPRRIEAEAVRDNLLHASGTMEMKMGGPEIDHKLGLKSARRSVYLRIAPEKEVEFLKVFDGPSVTECYERHPSIMPQQALALSNSSLAIEQARWLASRLSANAAQDEDFALQAYSRIVGRPPDLEELRLCREFLSRNPPNDTVPSGNARARENLVLVLFNHHEAVTVR